MSRRTPIIMLDYIATQFVTGCEVASADVDQR